MMPPRRAFTLIEMLITIGLILMLASLVIVALRGVREAANRTETTNALRQMMTAYNSYAADHRQSLLPGYITAVSFEPGGPFAGVTIDPDPPIPLDMSEIRYRVDAGPYVWRLAPYLGDEWETMFVDYRNQELLAKLNQELLGQPGGSPPVAPVYGAGSSGAGSGTQPSAIGISMVPSFGLNSIYLGGDDHHGGTAIVQRNPWYPEQYGDVLAATRLSEVKNPARIVVFAPSAEHDNFDSLWPPPSDRPVTDLIFGGSTLRPPAVKINGQWVPQWHITANEVIADADFSDGGGWPVARWGKDLIPVGHLDGSVTTELRGDLATDGTKWSPFETGYIRVQQ